MTSHIWCEGFIDFDQNAYVWDGWQLAQEYRSGTANTYAYGNYIDDRIATKNGSGTYYFHRSYNQTTEAVTDASGRLVERYTATNPYGGYVIQDASGNALSTSVIGNRSVFQGAPMAEPVSGLVYLRNRWYSPEMGRFVSRDPMGYYAGDLNLYRFVGNKPMHYTDPNGMKPFKLNFGSGLIRGDMSPQLVHDPDVNGIDIEFEFSTTRAKDLCECDQFRIQQIVTRTDIYGKLEPSFIDPLVPDDDKPWYLTDDEYEKMKTKYGTTFDDHPQMMWAVLYKNQLLSFGVDRTWSANVTINCLGENGGVLRVLAQFSYGFSVDKNGVLSESMPKN